MPRSCLLGTNLEPHTQLWGNVPASFLETDCNFCFESSFGTDRSLVTADSQAPPAPGLRQSCEGLKQRQGDTCVTGRLSRSFDLHVTIRPCCCLKCLVTVQAGRVVSAAASDPSGVDAVLAFLETSCVSWTTLVGSTGGRRGALSCPAASHRRFFDSC